MKKKYSVKLLLLMQEISDYDFKYGDGAYLKDFPPEEGW